VLQPVTRYPGLGDITWVCCHGTLGTSVGFGDVCNIKQPTSDARSTMCCPQFRLLLRCQTCSVSNIGTTFWMIITVLETILQTFLCQRSLRKDGADTIGTRSHRYSDQNTDDLENSHQRILFTISEGRTFIRPIDETGEWSLQSSSI
jgi:hypothetical protein